MDARVAFNGERILMHERIPMRERILKREIRDGRFTQVIGAGTVLDTDAVAAVAAGRKGDVVEALDLVLCKTALRHVTSRVR